MRRHDARVRSAWNRRSNRSSHAAESAAPTKPGTSRSKPGSIAESRRRQAGSVHPSGSAVDGGGPRRRHGQREATGDREAGGGPAEAGARPGPQREGIRDPRRGLLFDRPPVVPAAGIPSLPRLRLLERLHRMAEEAARVRRAGSPHHGPCPGQPGEHRVHAQTPCQGGPTVVGSLKSSEERFWPKV